MSYPYPQNRHLERKEKGDQPYDDAKEAMSQQDADMQARAEGYGEEQFEETEEERSARFEKEAKEHLREVGEEVARNAASANQPSD